MITDLEQHMNPHFNAGEERVYRVLEAEEHYLSILRRRVNQGFTDVFVGVGGRIFGPDDGNLGLEERILVVAFGGKDIDIIPAITHRKIYLNGMPLSHRRSELGTTRQRFRWNSETFERFCTDWNLTFDAKTSLPSVTDRLIDWTKYLRTKVFNFNT